jgi:hypothetical protein
VRGILFLGLWSALLLADTPKQRQAALEKARQEIAQQREVRAREKADTEAQLGQLKLKSYEMQLEVERLEKKLKALEESPEPTLAELGVAPPPPANQRARCSGRTGEGARCTRNAAAGTKYCWQHKR